MSSDRRTKEQLLADLADLQLEMERLRLQASEREAQDAATAEAAAVATLASGDASALVDTTQGERPLGHQAPNGARLLNLKPPQIPPFCGEREETERFLSAMDRALAASGMTGTLGGFHFATSHFEGSAQTWFESTIKAQPDVNSWPAIRPLLQKEFELVNAKRVYESRLLALVQTSTAQSYVDDFRSLSLKVNFDDDFLQYRFRMGLCNFLRERMVFQTPSNLAELQRLTLLLAHEFPAESTADSARNGSPLVAAAFGRKVAARKGKSKRFEKPRPKRSGHCYICKAEGHWADNCPERRQSVRKAGEKAKGSFRPGKYDGSGRVGGVHAVKAEAGYSSASDEELRSGEA